MFANLRSFLHTLRQEKDLVDIDTEVDPYLELAEIHRRVIAEGGPALLFRRVKGSPFPVVTNLFGTRRRVDLAVGPRPERVVEQAVEALPELLPPRPFKLWRAKGWLWPLMQSGLRQVSRQRAPVLEVWEQEPDLTLLPALTSWPEDGGPFVTLPLVYTEHPLTREHNLGMYRIQIYGPTQTGIHWQIHKGGGFHYYAAEQLDQALPMTLFLGGPPVLTFAAVAPLPEMVPELLFASFLLGRKLTRVEVAGHPHPLVAEAEFAICGEVPPRERRAEGPFGDHYGYYSLQHDFPVFRVQKVFHRRDAIYPATVVGKPRQEDYFLGEYLQELLRPLFPVVMPGVRDLKSYAETGFHALVAAVVRESYHREALTHAFHILGEAQLALTKFLMLTDVPVDLANFPEVLCTVLARFEPEQDLLILPETAMDTLDYTGRRLNHGSKAIMLGLGLAKRALPRAYTGSWPRGISAGQAYCPGCLLLKGPRFVEAPDLAAEVQRDLDPSLRQWPLLILVDDLELCQTQTGFLWQVFTRFDPAHDIYAESEVVNHKLIYHGPLLIDARMKPDYPDEVAPDPETVRLVDRRWGEYGIAGKG